MDCKTAKENINMFDFLTQEEKDDVLAHAHSCDECKQELIDSAKLREELSQLEELQPPIGLAQSAAAKARKKSKVPAFAYISVAVAAVIAVAVFATSNLLAPGVRDSESTMAMQKAETVESAKANGEAFDTSAGAVAADDSVEMTMEESADFEAESDADGTAADEMAPSDTAEESEESAASQTSIYIPADKTGFAEDAEVFLSDRGIYTESYMQDENTQIISFVVGEINLDEFKELMQLYEIVPDEEISGGTLIMLIVEKQ